MKRFGMSQEMLKLIACMTMLIDHIAAVLVIPSDAAMLAGDTTVAWVHVVMRGIGRVAFPIFCFLLVEGAHHTRNPRKYALRLSLGMVLSEIPFDLAFFGRLTWAHQSVMVTLLLGFMDGIIGSAQSVLANGILQMSIRIVTGITGLF